MNPSPLTYPNKSHRKSISLPLESEGLAELIGIILGDGGINNSWQLVISLNATADIEYANHVKDLLTRLFGIDVAVRSRPKNTIVLVCSSMNLLDFLISKGAVRGNKILQEITIPNWIKNNETYEKYCVRGLVDTDGCLFIHRHTIKIVEYINIGFCFTSFSPPLIDSVARILQKNEITPHISNTKTQIYLYKQSDVLKYLNIFGSSNPRILNKYQEWERQNSFFHQQRIIG